MERCYVLELDRKFLYKSKSMTQVVSVALDHMNKIYKEDRLSDDIGSQLLYVDAVQKMVKNVDIPLENEKILYLNHRFDVREVIPQKKYVVTYRKEYEDCVDTIENTDFLSHLQQFVCTESQLDRIVTKLRKDIEKDIESHYGNFNDRLGESIDCMVDTEREYEIYDHNCYAFYSIRVEDKKELNVGE